VHGLPRAVFPQNKRSIRKADSKNRRKTAYRNGTGNGTGTGTGTRQGQAYRQTKSQRRCSNGTGTNTSTGHKNTGTSNTTQRAIRCACNFGREMRPSNTNTQEIETHLGTDEQAADLAALQAMAAPEAQAGQLQPVAEVPTGPSVQSLQLAALAVSIIRPLAAYAVPALRTAPDALWEPIPQGLAGVLDHYDLSEQINNPWIGLALASAPLAAYAFMESAKAKPQDKPAAHGAGPDLSAPVPTEAPGQKTVTFAAS